MEKVKWIMVRGDTLMFVVKVESGGDGEIVKLDSIAFSCKVDATSNDYVFKKTLNNGVTEVEDGTYRVRVAPEDTANIEPGLYAIDLEIGVGDDIATPVLGVLKVLEDITRED